MKNDLDKEINKNKILNKQIESMKNDLDKEINKNKILNEQIAKLKNDLDKEINKNKILNEQIAKLKNELKTEINNKNKLIEINEKLKEEIKKLSNSQNIKEEQNNSNNDKDIIQLYKKIDELKGKLSRYPFELSEGEKLISVIFTSSDQKIHCSIICKNTDKFITLETKLYNDYPEYSETDNFFMANGSRVSKFKTLDQNKIKNSDNIILNKNEF